MAAKTCARCGRELPDENRRVYSSWSGKYYCIDLDDCQRRYERRLRLDLVFRAEQEQLKLERLERVNEAHERLAAANAKKRK